MSHSIDKRNDSPQFRILMIFFHPFLIPSTGLVNLWIWNWFVCKTQRVLNQWQTEFQMKCFTRHNSVLRIQHKYERTMWHWKWQRHTIDYCYYIIAIRHECYSLNGLNWCLHFMFRELIRLLKIFIKMGRIFFLFKRQNKNEWNCWAKKKIFHSTRT